MTWRTTIENELQLVQEFIKTNPKISLAIAAIIIFLLIILLRHIHIKSQYSKEAWKIVKKNGRKAIFWYDQYGNKTYKKPKINPNGPKPPKHRPY